MRKSIQIIATAFAILLGNVGFSQNDTIYLMKNGFIIGQFDLNIDVDSVIFYKPVELATLTTTTISSITETTALSGGNITNNGGGAITSRGICWGTSPSPSLADNLLVNGSGTGSFVININLNGITSGTTYYVRAYAINSAGTAYGNEVNFNSIMTDADGNIYTSVTIGTQEWMTENLRTTKYSDGTSIPNVTGNNEWYNSSTGAWSHYGNDSSQYEARYGKLYNWYAVNTSKLCPTGWHVPTDAEWTVLEEYLTANGHNGREGTALKATSGWGIESGTDNYGWLGLPGGYRDDNGGFLAIGGFCNWWSSSQANSDDAWNRGLYSFDIGVGRSSLSKKNGFSVRCLRD